MMNSLAPNVVNAKGKLDAGFEELRKQHLQGSSGKEVCMGFSDLRDDILRGLFLDLFGKTKGADFSDLQQHVALVAHGGYGRREVSPFSDADLMLLYSSASPQQVQLLTKELMRNGFDAGLMLGHSVRTPEQAAQLACRDPVIATSLVESRLLIGSETLFAKFQDTFRRYVRRQSQRILGEICGSRTKERNQYGEVVYLLEPNLKRSLGSLRDLHLIRWIGFIRYGSAELEQLVALGVISKEDRLALEDANEFLLRLRNEIHFHAGRAVDVLDQEEQLRIAEVFNYTSEEGMLAVERFMSEYFRHTKDVSQIALRFAERAREKPALTRLATAALSHWVDTNVRVGPKDLTLTASGLEGLKGNLNAIIRMAELANLYDKPIDPDIWEIIRREASQLPQEPSAEACRNFLALMAHPASLSDILRHLLDTGILELFIPAIKHARGLLQFNQYHKYTVDEHCLRAVDFAAKWLYDMGPVGRSYRRIEKKHILHLAALIHDLGKGFPEDHHKLGSRIARETGQRLGLSEGETELLEFLVFNHAMMNQVAFRRDTSDEQLVAQFVQKVGSPERLDMLFVLTASDMAAVGPGMWDGWKAQVLADLYHPAMQQLAGDSSATASDKLLFQRRETAREHLRSRKDFAWCSEQLDSLPATYIATTDPQQIADDLALLRTLGPGESTAKGQYDSETESMQLTIGTHENIVPGIFHRLTGALTKLGLEIRSAQINTLSGGLVLDRFWAYDPDYAGQPPPERIEQIDEALVDAIGETGDQELRFRRLWGKDSQAVEAASRQSGRISFDNSTSEHFTIIDIFAHDRAGLLYAITQALFELDLAVARAKISTHVDQVVDVFYVTNLQGTKVKDDQQIQTICQRLMEIVEANDSD